MANQAWREGIGAGFSASIEVMLTMVSPLACEIICFAMACVHRNALRKFASITAVDAFEVSRGEAWGQGVAKHGIYAAGRHHELHALAV